MQYMSFPLSLSIFFPPSWFLFRLRLSPHLSSVVGGRVLSGTRRINLSQMYYQLEEVHRPHENKENLNESSIDKPTQATLPKPHYFQKRRRSVLIP